MEYHRVGTHTSTHQSPPLPNLPKPYLILWQIDVLCRHITSIMKLILLLWKKEGATTTLLRHVSSAASVFKNSHLLGRIICRVSYIYQLFWNRFCHLHINKSSIIIYCQFIEKNHFYQIVHLQMIYALISSSGFISLSCQQIIKLYSSLLSANSAAAVRPHLNYREH